MTARIAQVVVIGHSAYAFGSGNNRAYVRSKAAAVRELCRRGVKRDDARVAVNTATRKPHSLQTVSVGTVFVCELYAMAVGEDIYGVKFTK